MMTGTVMKVRIMTVGGRNRLTAFIMSIVVIKFYVCGLCSYDRCGFTVFFWFGPL